MLSSLVVEVLKEYLYVSTLSPLRLRLGCTWQPQLLVSQVAAFNQDRDLQRSLAVSLPTNRHKGTSVLIKMTFYDQQLLFLVQICYTYGL